MIFSPIRVVLILEMVWLGDVPLSQQYPSLFSIVEIKQVLIADILANRPLHVTFGELYRPTSGHFG
jgi:hypothetical protein